MKINDLVCIYDYNIDKGVPNITYDEAIRGDYVMDFIYADSDTKEAWIWEKLKYSEFSDKIKKEKLNFMGFAIARVYKKSEIEKDLILNDIWGQL